MNDEVFFFRLHCYAHDCVGKRGAELVPGRSCCIRNKMWHRRGDRGDADHTGG